MIGGKLTQKGAQIGYGTPEGGSPQPLRGTMRDKRKSIAPGTLYLAWIVPSPIPF